MGYNITQSSIDKVKDHLDNMVLSSEDITWTITDGMQPIQLAYYLRQGIKSAETYAAVQTARYQRDDGQHLLSRLIRIRGWWYQNQR